jgi:hypothetical protein
MAEHFPVANSPLGDDEWWGGAGPEGASPTLSSVVVPDCFNGAENRNFVILPIVIYFNKRDHRLQSAMKLPQPPFGTLVSCCLRQRLLSLSAPLCFVALWQAISKKCRRKLRQSDGKH